MQEAVAQPRRPRRRAARRAGSARAPAGPPSPPSSPGRAAARRAPCAARPCGRRSRRRRSRCSARRRSRGASAFLRSPVVAARHHLDRRHRAGPGAARAAAQRPSSRRGAKPLRFTAARPQRDRGLELLAAAAAAVADEGGAVLTLSAIWTSPRGAGGREDVERLVAARRRGRSRGGSRTRRRRSGTGRPPSARRRPCPGAPPCGGSSRARRPRRAPRPPRASARSQSRTSGSGSSRERGLVDQRAPDHRVAPERLAREGLVTVGVGVERLGHALLRDGVRGPHERVLEEAHHRRREQVGALRRCADGRGPSPRPCRTWRRAAARARPPGCRAARESLLERGGAPGQARRERRLLGRVEDLEDLPPALPRARIGGLGERDRARRRGDRRASRYSSFSRPRCPMAHR